MRLLTDAELAKLTLFQGVNLVEIRPLIERCTIKSIPVGKLLLRPDTLNDQMFVVLSGQVSIHLEQDSNVPIAYVGEGECVGELSVFDGQNPSAYVKAVTSSDMLIIPRETLWDIVDQSHAVACNLLRLLSTRVRKGNEAVNTSQRLQKESEKEANVDPLTGLYNRRWLNTYFNRVLARAGHADGVQELAMLLVDADYFKCFNDEFGHHVGDVALKQIAKSLRDNIRPADIAARVGGEEFVLVFPDTTISEAKEVAERVRIGVEQIRMENLGHTLPPVTISIGIAMLRPNDSFVDLFAAADNALYRAKAAGRNRVVLNQREFYTSSASASV